MKPSLTITYRVRKGDHGKRGRRPVREFDIDDLIVTDVICTLVDAASVRPIFKCFCNIFNVRQAVNYSLHWPARISVRDGIQVYWLREFNWGWWSLNEICVLFLALYGQSLSMGQSKHLVLFPAAVGFALWRKWRREPNDEIFTGMAGLNQWQRRSISLWIRGEWVKVLQSNRQKDLLAAFGHERKRTCFFITPVPPYVRMSEMIISHRLDLNDID